MSFSQDIKMEILENLSAKKSCRQAFLSAIIKSSAEYDIFGGDIKVYLKTQVQGLCNLIQDIVQSIYKLNVKIEEDTEPIFNKPRYQITISGDKIKDMLFDLDIAYINEENCFEFYQDLHYENIVKTSEEVKAFAKGVFIACGSASGVDEQGNKSIDYHIEWVFINMEKAQDFVNMLSKISVFARIVKRKKLFVVYLQKFEAISDMLVLFDAQENMLKLNSEYAKRSVMNIVNRQSNCDTANMSKTIDNSLAQLEAIELIKNTIGFEKLDEDLISVCMLRLANVEESLQELANLSGMSKSAINYRFGKIMKIAKEIKEEQE